jgi:hypothetical protein
MAAKKLQNLPDGFSLYMAGGDRNGHCKKCGVISTIEYRGLDPIHPDFHVIYASLETRNCLIGERFPTLDICPLSILPPTNRMAWRTLYLVAVR